MDSDFVSGTMVGYDVCKALGLDPGKTDRVVIVVEAGDVVRVYARQFGDKGGIKALLPMLDGFKHQVQVVKDVAVDDNGEVEITPADVVDEPTHVLLEDAKQ